MWRTRRRTQARQKLTTLAVPWYTAPMMAITASFAWAVSLDGERADPVVIGLLPVAVTPDGPPDAVSSAALAEHPDAVRAGSEAALRVRAVGGRRAVGALA